MKKNLSEIWYIFLVVVLLADLTFSYRQYSLTPLDGDFSAIVMPSVDHDYAKVLDDPLGWSAFKGESYAATNRFTAHYIMSTYFKNVPLALQNIMSPIDSLYASVTLAKFLVHVSLLFLIAYFVSAWHRFQWKSFLIALVIISPMLHAGGRFIEYMAVIDPTITYVMFYALPMVAILIYFIPLYRYLLHQHRSSVGFNYLVWLPFSLTIVFFGTLPAPVIIISSMLIVYHHAKKQLCKLNFYTLFKELKNLFGGSQSMLVAFILVNLFSLYSIYIGTQNSENNWYAMSLKQRYALLPKGIYEAFFNRNNGLFYLLLATSINITVLYFFLKRESRLFFKLLVYLLVFTLVYIVLLPMGGYREYRPFILRRDTLLPVLFVLFFIWGTSSIYLVRLDKLKRYISLAFVAAVVFYFCKQNAMPTYTNVNEKEALLEISNSRDSCVVLPKTCTVLGWNYNVDCEDSKTNCTLLAYYHILQRGKGYCFSTDIK